MDAWQGFIQPNALINKGRNMDKPNIGLTILYALLLCVALSVCVWLILWWPI